MKKIILLLSILFTFPLFIHAQDEWKITGQIQLRSEIDGRDFLNSTHPLTYALLRTRLGAERTFMNSVNIFIQAQDSRVFGQELTTVTNSMNLDLHQGYIKLINPFDWELTVQAGRFEVSYGTERFFGPGNWGNVGRAWDGVRFSFDPGFKLDVFALTQREPSYEFAVAYPYLKINSGSRSLYGFWSDFNLNETNKLSVFSYLDMNWQKVIVVGPGPAVFPPEPVYGLQRFTAGINHLGTYDKISTIAEAALQFGKNAATDISAYLISGQVHYNFNPFKIGIGADILSGTDAGSTEDNTFAISYGTNHKYYGFMDYFTSNPFAGLNDLYLMVSLNPQDSKFSGSLNFHYFGSNKDVVVPRLGSGFNTNTLKAVYGEELDLTVKYDFVKGTSITWGGSLFFPGDLVKNNPVGTYYGHGDTAFWTYLMVIANL